MVVRQEGATPKIVGRHRDRRIMVASHRVDAGGCRPL